MSTILKALEKNKHQSQTVIIDKSIDTSWKLMMIAALLVITTLLAVVVFLLFKPAQVEMTAASSVVEPEPLIKEKPLVKQQPVNLVSEVDFKTIPLPKAKTLQKTSAEWISAEKTIITKEPETTAAISNVKVNNKVENSIELDQVSSDLQRRFALAVELEGGPSKVDELPREEALERSDISTMPARFQYQVPVMSYDSHMYSSEAQDRWIRINGVDLSVGDHIGEVELIDILPQQSVFRMGKQSFTLESLNDWKG